ncbi:hypothetical protein PHYSODRAFT_489423 [Phytophthora sojae]|uniref:Uncharacterized protein n=1 Tax=Phytophthora sojae (strain P6497) TaxID=1094619 RepID=G4Z4X8_PHYSP|nr:hypothetical protein PHYSODRAFT_489423 [Phytophthora sojae]EGZ22307.1 hypothetical protein PHYSODRAFT_489423 [Phytophthora sojae]|eukprot:XP_009525024.1 hypothetical protein PHYSODRAFT_489423 [Phytophthora sojae]
MLFSFLGSTIAASNLDFIGYIELYSKTQYERTFSILKITYASQCYSLACDDLDNQAASVAWNQLPNSTSDTLIFYSEANCTGHKASVRLDNPRRGVPDLT